MSEEPKNESRLNGVWHLATSVDKVKADEPCAVAIGEHQIALFSVDGDVFATDAICTHAHACLADGYQEGDTIECPLHEGKFHIPSGKALGSPVTENLNIFPVKVEDGQIYVEIAQ